MIQIYSIWEKYFYISAYQSSKLVFIRFILLMNENSSSWGQTMKTTNIKSESGKISLWEKLSYSGGDVASCITFGAVSSYLSYYYTDIAGILFLFQSYGDPFYPQNMYCFLSVIFTLSTTTRIRFFAAFPL